MQQLAQVPPNVWKILGMDYLAWALLVGGLLGSICKAAVKKDQKTLSAHSLVDVILGGLLGVFIPDILPFPDSWPIYKQGFAVAIISFSSSNLVTMVIGRFFPEIGKRLEPRNRRAADRVSSPDGGKQP